MSEKNKKLKEDPVSMVQTHSAIDMHERLPPINSSTSFSKKSDEMALHNNFDLQDPYLLNQKKTVNKESATDHVVPHA